MANKIQIKRGLKANLPTLSEGEAAFTTDEKKLYIGSNSGNIEIGGNGSTATATYTATITTTWAGTAAPYTQDITVNGILSSDNPIVDAVLSATLATAQAQEKAWGYVSKITTSTNTITVVCNKTKPTTAIPIQLKVVR